MTKTYDGKYRFLSDCELVSLFRESSISDYKGTGEVSFLEILEMRQEILDRMVKK